MAPPATPLNILVAKFPKSLRSLKSLESMHNLPISFKPEDSLNSTFLSCPKYLMKSLTLESSIVTLVFPNFFRLFPHLLLCSSKLFLAAFTMSLAFSLVLFASCVSTTALTDFPTPTNPVAAAIAINSNGNGIIFYFLIII